MFAKVIKCAVAIGLIASLSGCIIYSDGTNDICNCPYHNYINGTHPDHPIQSLHCPYHRQYDRNCNYCRHARLCH